jgi:hypothetical protein
MVYKNIGILAINSVNSNLRIRPDTTSSIGKAMSIIDNNEISKGSYKYFNGLKRDQSRSEQKIYPNGA